MKKKFLAFTIALCGALTISSCGDNDFDDRGFSNVQPGVVIYDEAQTTNRIALDALSIGFKFAILQTEMEAKGITIPEGAEGLPDSGATETDADWNMLGDVTYGNTTYSKKEFLFGEKDKVEILLTDAAEGIYTVTYGTGTSTHTSAAYDTNYRFGTFVINTKGKKLNETSELDAWEISLPSEADAKITYALTTTTSASITCELMTTNLYYDGEKYVFDTDTSARYTSVSGNPNTWKGQGSLHTTSADLSFDGTFASNYTFNYDASGTTISGSYSLSYETAIPQTYNPDSVPYRAVGGTEKVTLNNTDSRFPYNSVTSTSLSTGNRQIIYGPHSYYEYPL